MEKSKNIHSLDSLEHEIYRLRLEAKKKEVQIDNGFEYLQENLGSLLIHSFSCKKKTNAEQKNGFFKSAMKDEALRFAFNKVTGHLADRTIEGIDDLLKRILGKKNKS